MNNDDLLLCIVQLKCLNHICNLKTLRNQNDNNQKLIILNDIRNELRPYNIDGLDIVLNELKLKYNIIE